MTQYKNFFTAIVLAIFLAGIPVADAMVYRDRIYPGIKAGTVDIGGLTRDGAYEHLKEALDGFRAQDATFILEQTQTALRLGNLVEFDIDATVRQALHTGAGENFFENFKVRIASRTRGIDIAPEMSIHTETLSSLLTDTYRTTQTLAEDASFTFAFIEDKPPIVSIQPGRAGTVIDVSRAARDLALHSKTSDTSPIILSTDRSAPDISAKDLEALMPEVKKILEGPSVKVRAEGRVWSIENPVLATWIHPYREGGSVALKFNAAKIGLWIDEIAPGIEHNPVDALFELDSNQKKVVKFKPGRSGIQIPRDRNATAIAAALSSGVREIELIRSAIPPQILTAHGAELYGINRLLGRATTEFKGSPPNRVKNIARGAEILYGELIAPEEEFSLLEHLRPFTLENGYLSELVIKAAEGRTVPEIGGGLCQIGTTLFRTTLAAGLPITARRNHSYRVSYYEPPVGMDATIYDPWPDYKFKNDTGSWLLLTSYIDIKDMNITFELWGTADGRRAETTKPEAFNFRQPPEAKIIETTDLPPGVKKCTERSHIGSDAKFTYKVTYADGTEKEEEFFSRYRPWQEVCLVGVEPKEGEVTDTAPGEALPDTLPSADALGVVGDN